MMPMTRFDKAEYYKLVIVSYFIGYKVAYNRLKNSTGQISPMDIYTFYAEVQEITPSMISVEKLSLNERDIVRYDVQAETSVVLGNEVSNLSDLEQGDVVAIILVTGAGDITDIKIQLFQ